MRHTTTPPASISRRRYGTAAALGLGLATLPRVAHPATVDTRGGPDKYARLHSFGDPSAAQDGAQPVAGLVQATDGHLYGITRAGGLGGGAIFKVKLAANGRVSVRTVHLFDAAVEGASPLGTLIQASDGAIYGTTPEIGSGPCKGGSVFRLNPDGSVETLHAFHAGSDVGYGPIAGLVQAADGNLYGTTTIGGTRLGGGSVFRMKPTGPIEALHQFAYGEASGTEGELIQGSDGRLYGTTEGGGILGLGTVFAVSLAGDVVTLHDFSRSDGEYLWARVLQASDGMLYGTTEGGPFARHAGTVFRMNLDGSNFSFITLRQRSPIGYRPLTPLTEANDGALYGTTSNGGPQRGGCVYKLVGDRRLRVHAFPEVARGLGVSPGALIQASDGALYGTTLLGGDFGQGTLYRIGDLDG